MAWEFSQHKYERRHVIAVAIIAFCAGCFAALLLKG